MRSALSGRRLRRIGLKKIEEKKQETEKVEASSIEELIKKIKEKLYPEQAETEEEM